MQETKLIRNLLFAAAAAALWLVCTGCFTAAVLDPEFGSRSTRFGPTTYTMSPDRSEIIATSTKTTDYRYRLYIALHMQEFVRPTTLWSRSSTWEERVPVEPMPDGLMRCFLFVEPDPDAQAYWYHSRGEFEIETEGIPLCEDKTYYLRIRPDDRGILSRPFMVRLISREEAPGADAAVEPGQELPQDETSVPPEKKLDDDRRIMFPVAVNGNMYVLLTVAPREPRPNPFRAYKGRPASRAYKEWAESLWDTHEEVRYRYPFREAQQEIILTEYERLIYVRLPTWDAVLWKALWLPPAIVVDTLLLPEYIFVGGSALLLILTVGSAIQ
ncbi:MAG: hypothetical protein ILO68_03370 [Clostridia bacterium]|nr:hypothetical protein [Clostridia bacterium]